MAGIHRGDPAGTVGPRPHRCSGLAALLAGLLAGDWKPSDYHAPGEGIWWIGAVTAAGALVCAAAAVWPRYRREASDGIYYWAHVASYKTEAEFTAALDAQKTGSRERTRHQLHRLSHIVQRKYMLVRYSFVFSGVSIALLLLAALTG